MNKLKKYCWNLLISFDQFVNTICGGDPDETISSRMGKWAREGKNDSGVKKPLFKIANFIVEIFEKDHFVKSIENDEGNNETID